MTPSSKILILKFIFYSRCVQESNLVLALWRVVQQLTRILTMHPKLVTYLEVCQVEDLLKHLWGVLDHYLDTVRHLGRAILDNILQLKDTFLSIGENDFHTLKRSSL